jgi:hypothetical protein
MVVQVLWQGRLDRQRLVQKLFEEVFTRLLTHQNAPGRRVDARSTCPTHHLQDVGNGIVDVSVFLPIERLHAHDDDHVRADGEGPGSVLFYQPISAVR